MFMRTGFVLGEAGLYSAVLILLISKAITTLTALSLSAISTNTEVKGGGVYFMISRALGPDFGGTIGLTLFIAQAVGVSFYVIGFTEALVGTAAPFLDFLASENQTASATLASYYVPQIVSSLVVVGLFYLTFKGADVALKVQNYVLVILILSILSFLIGGFFKFDPKLYESAFEADYSPAIGFWVAFAIFFPATTGITAGANMSGDLKNPESAIPWGTLLAIVFTFIIYMLQMVLFAGALPREILKADSFEGLKTISLFSPLVVMGVFAATLSSALGSLLGAPRILQAMGRDGLISALSYFAKGEGPADEPKRATILTFLLAIGVIWAGDLNAVAEVISMFFLIAYGTINLSAFVESRGGNPSFRPQFRFYHWITALVGSIGCLIAMMKINDTYALIALALSSVIYFYLQKKDIQTSYGDAKRGYVFRGVRNGLRQLQGTKAHPKNWRPILLTLSRGLKEDNHVIHAGSWLENERGLYTVALIEPRPDDTLEGRMALAQTHLESLAEFLRKHQIKAFKECVTPKDYREGLFQFLQNHSIGALKPNTVMLSRPDTKDEKQMAVFYECLEILASFNLNLVVYRSAELKFEKKKKVIDFWWRQESNASLMALFSYLMSLHSDWSGSRVRLLRATNPDENRVEVQNHMKDVIRQARLDAETKIIRYNDDALVQLRQASRRDADFVFIGMGATDASEAKQSIESLLPELERLPSTALVWSNGEANIFV